MWNVQDSGIDPDALRKFIDEQIYTLPGTDAHRDVFSILLSGSRAYGAHKPNSDVDLDVLCPQSVYDSVHRASLEAGIIKSPTSFWCSLKGEDWPRYYGEAFGRPHFSLNSLENIERQIGEYDDVALWIWTNARIISDPNGQFRRVVDRFHGYSKEVLVGKIKYRWLLSGYWAVDGYPGTHAGDDELLAAALSVLCSFNELLRISYLVEGKPFPYAEKLLPLAGGTKLGREFGPLIQRSVDLAVGRAEPHRDAWDRLDEAIQPVRHQDPGTEGERLAHAFEQAMIEAGVEADWVEADYDNIDELLLGKLGPPP